MRIEDAELVLSVIELPFIRISTYEEKRGGGWTGYAAVVHGTRHRYQSWCHDPDETNYEPWHRSEVDAWSCFDKNHPGLIDALRRLDELLEPQGN